ncbi:ferritin-like protein [Streptomyces sp. NPDC057877]|uniref:ferritin-like domain-containing protein n=1 Tax=Streptomyces sp. NPDC057877 TaxID=3346269 RepID=UPI0036943F38
MNTYVTARKDRIVSLLDQPVEQRDVVWLKEAAQQAILLELATLPPYLCGLWSIDDTGGDEQVPEALRAVVFDEMSHLGLACNLLTTIGGTPRLADASVVPTYPGPLPGGVRPTLNVTLGGLTRESAGMYARIEEPDDPVVRGGIAAHTSIGAFYTAVLEAFRAHPELIRGTRQLTRNMAHHGSGNNVESLNSLAAVESAIGVIKEQGEGTSASPENPHPGEQGELAHFYVFRAIHLGRELVEDPEYPGQWAFNGPEIPLPRTLPMGLVPSGGWPRKGPAAADPETAELLDGFNRSYNTMLELLEKAWQQDVPAKAKELLGKAVVQMFTLQEPARLLMRRPLPDGSGQTYGPEFRHVSI